RASISQIPLRLAWAITVHTSQGMTLDGARIDLRKAFVEGMGYVALSRVRDIDNLYLYGINRKALAVSPDALAIDELLDAASQQAAEKYEYLRTEMKRNPPPVSSDKKKSDWRERIDKMRETYPNAFRPWTDELDAELKQDFQQGMDLDALCEKFGRQPGSIIARLKKFFGEDVVA
ncbi:hypothetical protein B7Z17_01535, partial [Candidatus Saccharibacteria bacterium 32-49-10]